MRTNFATRKWTPDKNIPGSPLRYEGVNDAEEVYKYMRPVSPGCIDTYGVL
jgi:hypothetical protein